MNVTSFNNQTYATDTTAPEFSVTWEYPPGPQNAPVHAFPNIKVDGGVFPRALSAIKGVQLDFEWTMGVGNETVATTDQTELTAASVNANVAMDMFLDADKDKATESSKAKYEIMVWFARIGPATHPIGLDDGSVAKVTINGTNL
jgi:glycosyl hydrolase family 12